MLERFETVGADELALEVCNVACVVAEDAGRFVLLEDDLVFIYEDLNSIAVLDIHGVSDFDRENYSAEFVYLSYYACGLHDLLPPYIMVCY